MQVRLVVFLFSLLFGIGAVSLYRSIGEVVSPARGEHLVEEVSPIETSGPGEILLADTESDPDIREFHSSEDAFSGWYSFKGSKGLKDVNLVLISRDGGQDSDVDGGVFTNFETADAGFVEMSWAKLEGDQVSFRTKRIRGFEFEFRGAFFKDKMTGEEGEVILHGTISQFRNKKLVAKATGDFAYFEPQCWH